MLYCKYSLHTPTFTMQDITVASLKARKAEMQKFYDRADAAYRYALRASEDESLREEDYIAIDAALDRMGRIGTWLDEGIEALDAAIDAYEKLEDNLRFALEDVPEVIKEGGRK